MKKYLLSLAILIAVSISAKAQFSLGIKGGVNFSRSIPIILESTETGYQAGVFPRVGGRFICSPKFMWAVRAVILILTVTVPI